MDESIFRKKSIDKVSSPDQLNEYIRVATPGVWLILSAIIIFLRGIIVWGIFGTITTTARAAVVVGDGRAVCYANAGGAVPEAGMELSVGGKTGTVGVVSSRPVQPEEGDRAGIMYAGGFDEGAYCYTAEAEIEGISDGIYPAEITVSSVHPISFVLQ